jgi:hypothetical protein
VVEVGPLILQLLHSLEAAELAASFILSYASNIAYWPKADILITVKIVGFLGVKQAFR